METTLYRHYHLLHLGAIEDDTWRIFCHQIATFPQIFSCQRMAVYWMALLEIFSRGGWIEPLEPIWNFGKSSFLFATQTNWKCKCSTDVDSSFTVDVRCNLLGMILKRFFPQVLPLRVISYSTLLLLLIRSWHFLFFLIIEFFSISPFRSWLGLKSLVKANS